VGAADHPRRSLGDKFLHGAIVSANAYQCTKFQLPSSIGFRDMDPEGLKIKIRAADFSRRTLADKFLHWEWASSLLTAQHKKGYLVSFKVYMMDRIWK